jgi:hypothetical protein
MTIPDMADVIALVLLISTGAGYLRTRAGKIKANQAAQTKHWRTT